MIAYDYDSINEEIIFHLGKRTNDFAHGTIIGDRDSEFEYDRDISFIWIEINEITTEHVCSNYYKNSVDNTYHCMCEFHSQLEHKHVGECITYEGLLHQKDCKWCGLVWEEHYYHSYGRYNKIGHYVYCECSYQIGTGRHIVPAGGGIGFKLCIYCGERLDTSIDITPVPGTNSVSIRYITEAGSYVDADGVVVLVESDMQLLLAGQLDVEALVAAPNNTVTE